MIVQVLGKKKLKEKKKREREEGWNEEEKINKDDR